MKKEKRKVSDKENVHKDECIGGYLLHLFASLAQEFQFLIELQVY